MYADIVVPCDGSPEAEHAAGHAIELADRFDATIHALFVVEPDASKLEFTGRHGIETELRDRGTRALTEVREWATERGVAVETTLAEGDPASAIVEYVEDEDADLVVMGTHGRSGVERILIGSVAERVVRTSPVPVTTVGLNEGGQSVTSADRARRIAREQLATAGHDDAVIDAPSQQRSTWVVHATAGENEYNVHINGASGRAKLVPIDGRP